MPGRDDSPPVRTIGRYRIDGELGRGGMGVVYAAYDLQQGRSVALKVIAPEIARDTAFAARFQREARIAVSLEHPNVIPVYETGSHKGALFIAMRRVDGADLGVVLAEQGALPLDRTVRLARQIGSALDAAHASGLVHRDVKPGNVLLTGSGDEEHCYLTDFGLAREAASDTGLTNTGQWMGTADYVAPEQIEGAAVSARTDIYSLGCVLFQLLTGHVPYSGALMRKLYAHAQDPLPSVGFGFGARGRRRDDDPPRATAKRPSDRYPSAGDLARALAAAATGRDEPQHERSVATGAALSGIPAADAASRPARPWAVDDDVAYRAPSREQAPPQPSPYSAAGETALDPAASGGAPPRGPSRSRDQPHAPAPNRRRGSLLPWALLAFVVVAAGVGGGVALSDKSNSHADASTSTIGPTRDATTTEPGATPPAATPPPVAAPAVDRLPAVSDAVMANDAVAVLRRFYETQVAGDFDALRRLTTGRYRSRVIAAIGYSQWVTNQRTGMQYMADPGNITGDLVDKDPSDGSVTIDLRGLGWTQAGSKCSRWEGITWARYEGGRWLVDPSPSKATAARAAQWGDRGDELLGAGCFVS
jgi:serine/threonine protein kinase